MPPEQSEWPRYIVGSAEQVRDRLARIAEALTLDELMILTIVHDHHVRVRSYELLAEAFGLTPRDVTPPGAGAAPA